MKTEGNFGQDYSTHMMLQDCKVGKVQIINNHNSIRGFKIFDRSQTLILNIGDTNPSYTVTEVALGDTEQIVGVAYKLFGSFRTIYTDFQFQIARQ